MFVVCLIDSVTVVVQRSASVRFRSVQERKSETQSNAQTFVCACVRVYYSWLVSDTHKHTHTHCVSCLVCCSCCLICLLLPITSPPPSPSPFLVVIITYHLPVLIPVIITFITEVIIICCCCGSAAAAAAAASFAFEFDSIRRSSTLSASFFPWPCRRSTHRSIHR